MNKMFEDCNGLTSINVSHFDTSKVTDMGNMFRLCSGLKSLDVSNFDTSKVTEMSGVFQGCSGLTSLDVSHFDTSNVTRMVYMFLGCSGLTSLDVSHFNTSKVTNMSGMFDSCRGLTSLDVSHFDTSKVTGMDFMFRGCSGLTSLDVSHFDTSNVTNMGYMFWDCSGLTSLDVSHFDTSKVSSMYSMYSMFCGCSGLTSLDVSNFNTSNVTNMGYMFCGCSGLTSLDVSHFDTNKVTDMQGMFFGCSGLTNLDLSSFNTSNVIYMNERGHDGYNFEEANGMFEGCINLKTIYAGEGWTTDKVTYSKVMFANCPNLVGGKGTRYDANHIDKAYAHIDGGPSNPGYLTDVKDKKVSNEVDLQDLLDGIDEGSGTEEHPFIVPVASSGMTVGGNVDIDKEVHLLFNGGTGEPLCIDFHGGIISVNNKNSSLSFNNVIMTTATANCGGIDNGGKLLLTGCTVADGLITNYGSIYIDGATAVGSMTNRLGGRIYITSPMTKNVSISISENDIETGIPIITGGNDYTLTAEDATHISIALPAAYEWKYDASIHAIVISKKGDSNDDNTIDVADIATIISYMAGDTKALDLKSVDVNGDGVVDVADIASVISNHGRKMRFLFIY
ncbi:MAG: BspA family leucine-rich repeat surface protein [Bacteroidales bacterium]|nr:BspA family leucine-rich repeat surface protein [Bacteroidales bacterium]